MSLMQYIAPQPRRQEPAGVGRHGADKYHGAISAGYDAKRQGDPKWLLEQYWIEDMLDDLPAGSSVLDIPCGTGRFFQFYGSKGFVVKALDVSTDQLEMAARKLQGLHASGMADGSKFKLAQGDVRKLGAPDKCVDAVVCSRLTRWLSPEDNVVAFKELARVARNRIIWTARIANHPHARCVELFESALQGWKITRNEVGADSNGSGMDYRILEARPC